MMEEYTSHSTLTPPPFRLINMVAPFGFTDPKNTVDVTADMTLALIHKGQMMVNKTANDYTITVPLNSSVPYPIGSEIGFGEWSTGRLLIGSTAGLTFQSANGTDITAGFPRNVARKTIIKKIALNTWRLEDLDVVVVDDASGFQSTVVAGALTANRQITAPNRSGFAVTMPTDLVSLANAGKVFRVDAAGNDVEVVPSVASYIYTTPGVTDVTIPPCTRMRGYVISGGSGGGSGRKGAPGTARFGGGGGAGSGITYYDFGIAELGLAIGDKISISVGAGGLGGASVSANSTTGNPGAVGEISFIRKGTTGSAYIANVLVSTATSAGGTSTNGGGGSAITTGLDFSGGGGGGSATSPPPANGISVSKGAGGGGGSGGIDAANTPRPAGNGGRGSGAIDSIRLSAGVGGAIDTSGSNGAQPNGFTGVPGDGGGGGGASITGNAGNGGNGALGGGGGGGGAATDGVGNSGAGGNGGNGAVSITFY